MGLHSSRSGNWNVILIHCGKGPPPTPRHTKSSHPIPLFILFKKKKKTLVFSRKYLLCKAQSQQNGAMPPSEYHIKKERGGGVCMYISSPPQLPFLNIPHLVSSQVHTVGGKRERQQCSSRSREETDRSINQVSASCDVRNNNNINALILYSSFAYQKKKKKNSRFFLLLFYYY